MEIKGSAAACRRELAKGLRKDAPEIVGAIIGRLELLENGSGTESGWRSAGARKVVGPTLEYVCRAIEGKADQQPPPEVIANARKLAESGFPASTLLRRYDASKSVFREHLRKVAASLKTRSDDGFAGADRAIDHAFERLMEVVEEEHAQVEHWLNSPRNARELEVIEQLLGGKLLYPPDLGYDFSATHVGVVGSGPGVEDELRRLAQMLGGEMLIVQSYPDEFWAWIGLKLPSSAERLDDVLNAEWADTVRMAIGKPMDGLSGWRRSHFQAKVAFSIAIRGHAPIVRYADVALLAAAAEDDLLPNHLQEDYLAPLASTRDGGATLKAALRAYFSKDRHISSAAKALGVKRHTVRKRLDDVEGLLGRTLESCSVELALALKLEKLLPSPSNQGPKEEGS